MCTLNSKRLNTDRLDPRASTALGFEPTSFVTLVSALNTRPGFRPRARTYVMQK